MEQVRSILDFADGAHVALDFGRNGEHLDDVRILVDEFGITGSDVLAGLRALLGSVDERTFSVDAHDLGAVEVVLLALIHNGPDGRKSLLKRVVGNRHRGGQPAGNAVGRNALGHLADAVFFAVRRVLAEVAVNVHIYKTRKHVFAFRVDYFFVRNLVQIYDALNLLVVNQRHIFNDAVGSNNFTINNRFHASVSFTNLSNYDI